MPIQPDLFFLPALLPKQEFLSAPVPALYGPIAYREWKSQLERIHEVPRLSCVEETFQRLSLAQRNLAGPQAADKDKRPFYKWGAVEQGRCQLLCSQALHAMWRGRCWRRPVTAPSRPRQSLDLTEALNPQAYFLDTTCVKLHIHFPTFQWIGCCCGTRGAR